MFLCLTVLKINAIILMIGLPPALTASNKVIGCLDAAAGDNED